LRSALISLDGARVYLLAYPPDFSTATPRVFVFDSSAQPIGSGDLPALGYFDLVEYPTCTTGPTCDSSWVAGAISLDSSTLFFGGNERLLVVPIPLESTLSPLSAPITIGAGKSAQWRLERAE
jgi:hypothetical protein